MARRVFPVLCVVFGLGVAPAPADEGMWLLTQIAGLAAARQGLRIPPTRIYRPDGPCLARAAVEIGGGSGAFVSPQGLVLTNHHVAFGALVQLTRKDRPVFREGFHAARRQDEAYIRNLRCRVTLRCEDVTRVILEGVGPDLPEAERERRVTARIRELVRRRQEEAGDPTLTFVVKEAFWGAAYYLYVSRVYEDVRLVYAPPEALGQFGGDTDNWMWPRHSGDFAFFRVYAAPDGKPRRHHPENVPLHPEVWLRTRPEGPGDGEFVFVLGYPGRTYRHRSSFSVRYHRDDLLPQQVRRLEGARRQLAEMPDRPRAALNRLGIENQLKNYRGKILWLRRLEVAERMAREEAELRRFLGRRAERARRYGDVFDVLADIYRRVRERDRVNAALDRLRRSVLLRAARTLAQAVEELRKPEAERRRRFRGEGLARTLARVHRRLKERRAEADDRLARESLAGLAALPGDMLPPSLRPRTGDGGEAERRRAVAARARELVRRSALRDPAGAEVLLRRLRGGGRVEDPLVRVAGEILAVERRIPSQAAIAQRLRRVRRRLYAARRAWKPELLRYPDADRTLRFGFGHVRGYRPRDAVVYEPFTTVRGILEKQTGKPPFAAPPHLLELLRRRDFGRWARPDLGTVPVAFLSDLDITGGSSGSPVLDARGRLVGVVFDGTWEGITSDYRYEPAFTRTIAVHPAYAGFVLERFSKADNVLREWLRESRR